LLTFACVVLMCFLQNLSMLKFPLTCLISYFFSCLNFNIMIVQSTTCVFKCAKVCQNAKNIWGCHPTKGFFLDKFLKNITQNNRGLSLVCQILKHTFLQVVKQHYDYKKKFVILHILLQFNVKSFLGC